MRIYLDTNVYHLIAKQSQAPTVRQFLDHNGHSVIASSENLVETWAAPDSAERTDRIRAITMVAQTYDDHPQSFRHADELLKEIKRCRPRWLRRFPDQDGVGFRREALRGHRARWSEAKEYPSLRPTGFPGYRCDAETADLTGQKQFRQALLQLRRGTERVDVDLSYSDPELTALTAEYTAAEVFVRHSSALVWQQAIRDRHPAMRDYFDWLSPYVNTDSFAGRDYLYFWLRDVDLARMPLNTITGLAEFYQPQYKITHGNFLDCIHANYLVTADILVTADQAFYKVLTHVCENHEANASPVLISWGGSSAAG